MINYASNLVFPVHKYPEIDTITNSIDDYNDLNTITYQNNNDKLLNIISIIESLGYYNEDTSITINSFNTLMSNKINLTNLEVFNIMIQEKEMTITGGSVNKKEKSLLFRILIYTLKLENDEDFIFTIITDFSILLYLKYCYDVNNKFRGHDTLLNLISEIDDINILNNLNLGSKVFGINFNTFGVFCLLNHLNIQSSEFNKDIMIINIPNLFLDNSVDQFEGVSGITYYRVVNSIISYPYYINSIDLQNQENISNIITLKRFNIINNVFQTTIKYNTQVTSTDPMYLITPYCIRLNIIKENIILDCNIGLNYNPPNECVINFSIEDENLVNLRNLHYIGMLNLDTNVITNYKNKVYKPTLNFISFQSTDDVQNPQGIIYFNIFDDHSKSFPVQNITNFTKINYQNPDNGLIEYSIYTELNQTYDFSTVDTTYGIDSTFNNKVVIYSFGYPIHLFLRDLVNHYPSLDLTTNVLIYIEGLQSVSTSFTTFSEMYNIPENNIKIYNILQDNIVNGFSSTNANSDPIKITKLFDNRYQSVDYLKDYYDCIHSSLGYQLFLAHFYF